MDDQPEEMPTEWKDLPEKFKIGVVKLLNCRARCNLRLCSQADKSIVDETPLVFEKLEFSLHTQLRVYCYTDVGLDHTDNFYPICMGETEVTTFLLKLLKNPNVIIKKLVLEYSMIARLVLELRKLKQKNFDLEVMTILASRHHKREELAEYDLEFLSYFNVKSLYLGGRCPSEYFKKLVTMVLWKNARRVRIKHDNDFDIQHYSHFNSFNVSLTKLNIEDVKKLIEMFINKKTPESTSFTIQTSKPMRSFKILPDCNEELKAAMIEERLALADRMHFQQFNLTHSNDLVLVVQANPYELTGKVCRLAPYTIKDFWEYTGI